MILLSRIRKLEKEILELHLLVVKGLSNGLSYTSGDKREKDYGFWKKRSELFDRFEQCVVCAVNGQPYESEREDLERIAEEGYGQRYG